MFSTLIATVLAAQNPAIRAETVDPGISPALVGKVSALFAQALEDHGVAPLQSPPDGALEWLRQAREASTALQLARAVTLCDQGLAEQQAHPERVRDLKVTVDLQMVKLVAMLALKKKDVSGPLSQVRALAPGYTPSIDDFAPAVINAFDSFKAKETPFSTRVTITTTPALAELFVDGVSRGPAPVVLTDLRPGLHHVRAALADSLDAAQWVQVQSGTQTVELSLSTDEALTRGTQVSVSLRTGAPAMAAQFKAWAQALHVDAWALVLTRERNDLVIVAARATAEGKTLRRATRLSTSLADAPTRLQALVEALFTDADTGWVPGITPSPQVDWARTWVGLQPVAPAASLAPPPPPMTATETPLLRRPLFWVLVGTGAAVIAGGTATALVLTHRPGLDVTVTLPGATP